MLAVFSQEFLRTTNFPYMINLTVHGEPHGGSGRKAHADQPKAPTTVASTTAQMVERFYALLKLRNEAVAPESRVHPVGFDDR